MFIDHFACIVNPTSKILFSVNFNYNLGPKYDHKLRIYKYGQNKTFKIVKHSIYGKAK